MPLSKSKNIVFLKDVFLLAITAFGGPQAHMALFFKKLVEEHHYIKEEELVELNALCSILPGPTSTQTITAIGFKIGGPKLAYFTLLVWALPAVSIMTTLGIMISVFQSKEISLGFTKFIQPMAVGFVAYAAWRISRKLIKTKMAFAIMVVASLVSFLAQSPYAFPIILILGGLTTAYKYKRKEKEQKKGFEVVWANFLLWGGIFVGIAVLGGITGSLPIRLFENFYRNGSLIFGGGQVLIPLLLTEFAKVKGYLTVEEFQIGFAFIQALPGPVFAFCAYVGAITMEDYGVLGQVAGGFIASVGIFIPGTFLIFFIIRIWDGLKRYRVIKASLEGINGAASGMVIAAAGLLYVPMLREGEWLLTTLIIITTFCILQFTKIPAPLIILGGLIMGFIV